jgi:hypothetical protein
VHSNEQIIAPGLSAERMVAQRSQEVFIKSMGRTSDKNGT